jgi:transcription initiation factor IIE alpha subunit
MRVLSALYKRKTFGQLKEELKYHDEQIRRALIFLQKEGLVEKNKDGWKEIKAKKKRHDGLSERARRAIFEPVSLNGAWV